MSDDSEEPDFLSVRCPQCEARLRIRARLAGQAGKCPSCGAKFTIPVRPEVDFELPQPGAEVAALDESGGYRLAAPLEHETDDQPPPLPQELRTAPPERGYLDQLARVREQVIEVPPRFLFFSGVFEFPWYPEVWLRWVYLVIGGCMAALIPMVALSFLAGASGYATVGVAFFALPQLWISMWTGSFAAACGMRVFEDTAAGSNHVSDWPDPNWREWMLPLMHMGYVALMVLAIGYGIGLACGGSLETILLVMALSEFVLFPICLLSVLEANNIAILLSPRLLRSVIQKPVGWLQFYLVTGALFAAWGGLAWFIGGISTLLLILLHGVLYATVSLIWFWLLGRLAWLISHSKSKQRRAAAQAFKAAT